MMKIFTILVFAYLAAGEPYTEAVEYKRFMAALGTDKNARVAIYRAAFLRTWIVTLAILAVTYFSHIPFSELGYRPMDLSIYLGWPLLGKIAVLVLFALFVLYMIAPIALSMLGAAYKRDVARRLQYVVHITPANGKETAWWVANSVSSVNEELIYRGFIFFACLLWWPTAPLIVPLAVSSVLDGMRYLHRPAAALNVVLTGVISCLLFIAFDSLWIAMAVHVLHDIRVLAFPLAESHALARQNALAQQNAIAVAEKAELVAASGSR